MAQNKPFVRNKNRRKHLINGEILHREVRITGDGIESQIVSIGEANRMAENMDLDLVEINKDAKPPVCKIIDYSKMIFQQKKRDKDNKKNAVNNKIKEIRLSPNIDEHDMNFKIVHAENFIKQGSRVKVFLQFKGRSFHTQKDIAELKMLEFADSLKELAVVESMPVLNGRRMIMFLKPKK